MGVVGLPDWHDDVSHADVEAFAKRLLDPELLQSHLAAALNFVLEFSGFLGLDFHGHFAAAVLKLDFAAHAPALAEIVAQIDDYMRQVHATVAFGVFVTLGVRIAEHIVAVEVAGIDGLAVAAHGEPR